MQGRAIYKQAMGSGPVLRFEWPAGSEIIHAGVKEGQPCIWFICNPAEPRTPRTFLLLPTGGPYGEGEAEDEGWTSTIRRDNHIATFCSEDGELVGHLFETGGISESGEQLIKDDLKAAGKVANGGGWG